MKTDSPSNFRSSHPEQGEQGELYRWVKASERLPEDEDDVLVYMSKMGHGKPGSVYVGVYEKGKWKIVDTVDGIIQDANNNPDYWIVTHWAELPNPPGKLSSPPPEGQDDPVAFVKWIGCKFFYDDESELWETIPEGKTYDFNGQKQFRFTSDELYKLFKMQKDFIGDPDECTGAFEGQ